MFRKFFIFILIISNFNFVKTAEVGNNNDFSLEELLNAPYYNFSHVTNCYQVNKKISFFTFTFNNINFTIYIYKNNTLACTYVSDEKIKIIKNEDAKKIYNKIKDVYKNIFNKLELVKGYLKIQIDDTNDQEDRIKLEQELKAMKIKQSNMNYQLDEMSYNIFIEAMNDVLDKSEKIKISRFDCICCPNEYILVFSVNNVFKYQTYTVYVKNNFYQACIYRYLDLNNVQVKTISAIDYIIESLISKCEKVVIENVKLTHSAFVENIKLNFERA